MNLNLRQYIYQSIKKIFLIWVLIKNKLTNTFESTHKLILYIKLQTYLTNFFWNNRFEIRI